MKRYLWSVAGGVVVGLMIAAGGALAAEGAVGKGWYRPPLRGAPVGVVGGGTRSLGQVQVQLMAVAPDHVGLTAVEHPTLFWSSSAELSAKLELTIAEDETLAPVWEQTVDKIPVGLSSIKLDKVALKPGVVYQWSVSAIVDPANRSQDLIAGGALQLVGPSSELRAQLKGAAPGQLPQLYGANGYWYDTVASLVEQLRTHPQDATLKVQWDELLTSGGGAVIGAEVVAK